MTMIPLSNMFVARSVSGRRLASFRMPLAFHPEIAHSSLVFVDEVRRFIQDCLSRVGVPSIKLRCISDFLVAADYRGIYGSGLNRLEIYLNDLHHRYVRIDADPVVISETPVVAHVSGNGALGVIVGNFCMDLAVEKARRSGLGLVVAKQSQHFGMAAWYAFRAMSNGFAGLVLSNAAPLMVPPGSQESVMGANCLAFGVKGKNTHFMLDMATSAKDIGSIEWAFMKNDYIPHNWAADECGVSTCFPSLALSAQRLFPAGDHKGFCLAALIDVLCGVMSGSNYATRIPRWNVECQQGNPNLGQIFLALDPCYFIPDFMERLDDFNSRIKNSRPKDKMHPIRLPGELEKLHMDYVDDLRALPYPNILLAKYKVIADMLCVKPIQLAFGSCPARKKCFT
ncbi:uncharacterized protein Dwil_GK19287 [Drosophila willistoni]|uniref:Uncharacterized protein n=2 Tax=Drosophila willistoni TaxID=7260 RepID=B4MMX2_DROWI|nr:uncharacterized protein Dwil_GK19287 [Drosophila willistoni]